MSILSALRRLLPGGRYSPEEGPLTGAHFPLPDSPRERRLAARWGYRLILLREPEAEHTLEWLSRAKDTKAMRDALINSREARWQLGFPLVPALTGREPPLPVEVHVSDEERQQLFERVQQVWHRLGEEKPHWSVVTADEFRPNRIAREMDNFYGTGENDVGMLIHALERSHIDVSGLRSVLDFGCGVGRLSLALAKRFAHVTGVDVSAPHLALARKAAAERGASNVSFIQLDRMDQLDELPMVDLVYSILVLQHNPPPVMHAIFESLLRRLNPGGVAVIQMPTYKEVGYTFTAKQYLAEPHDDMEMHALPQHEVFASVHRHGIHVLEVMEDTLATFGVGARSNTFVLQRPAATK